MMPTPVEQAVQRLHSAGLATHDAIQGCTAQEIGQLEVQIGTRLPHAYRAFLALCGRGAGNFLIGTDWTYPKLPDVQLSAADLLRDCREAALPATAFVIAMHQGYEFLFFDSDAGDDPPVYLFSEVEDAPKRVFDTFSQWLSQCVEDEIAIYAELDRESPPP